MINFSIASCFQTARCTACNGLQW